LVTAKSKAYWNIQFDVVGWDVRDRETTGLLIRSAIKLLISAPLSCRKTASSTHRPGQCKLYHLWDRKAFLQMRAYDFCLIHAFSYHPRLRSNPKNCPRYVRYAISCNISNLQGIWIYYGIAANRCWISRAL
jgi:hypothetical protein